VSRTIGIPIAIGLLAFFFGDEGGFFVKHLEHRVLNISDRSSIRSRLSALGKYDEIHYENFRLTQFLFIAIPTFLIIQMFLLGILDLSQLFLSELAVVMMGIFAVEQNLSLRVKSKRASIDSEFATLVEMLTLAIGAGESPASAIKRLSIRAKGYLADEFAVVIAEVDSGTSFMVSLDSMSKRLESVVVRRFVDSLIISISRGTPLVETLTHSANEARSEERVKLLAAAGKAEISMMIPVVFLILPISILFALFPSLVTLNLFS
jgi:tight adherence protein C